MMRRRYARPIRKVLRKIRRKIPLSYGEIALHFGIERRIVKNIFFMYRNYGRDSVESITLSQEQISEIIRLKYPDEGEDIKLQCGYEHLTYCKQCGSRLIDKR